MDYQKIIELTLFEDKNYIQPPPIILINEKIVATEQNFITISGLPKSFKTSWTFFFIASALLNKEIFNIKVNLKNTDNILHIDTEQSKFDFARQIKLLKKQLHLNILPINFTAFLFREYEPDTILNTLEILIEQKKPKLIILDNLTELVINPNDIPESKKIIQFLKKISSRYNCVIVCLLHLGKSTLNTLGNLGSYADRGSQTTLKVTFDKDTNTSTLEPIFMRSDLYFKPISIKYDFESKNFLQVEAETKEKTSTKFDLLNCSIDEHRQKLIYIFFNLKELQYKDLIQKVCEYYGVGVSNSKKIISTLLIKEILLSSNGVYQKNF